MKDFITGHIPNHLVYGPVDSRRFGRSLGVSCSAPGPVACRWHCPYCQLGARPAGEEPRQAPVADILDALARSLALRQGERVDAVTVAGNGEPLDHPDFDRIASAAIDTARAWSAKAVLLTNGDGLARWRHAVAGFDLVYLKWDPGPAHGAWRAMSSMEADRRRRLLRGLPGLRIQAMLVGIVGRDRDDDRPAMDSWISDLRDLRPSEVHLTTLERPAPSPRFRPAAPERLAAWREAAQRALGVPVLAFPATGVDGAVGAGR